MFTKLLLPLDCSVLRCEVEPLLPVTYSLFHSNTHPHEASLSQVHFILKICGKVETLLFQIGRYSSTYLDASVAHVGGELQPLTNLLDAISSILLKPTLFSLLPHLSQEHNQFPFWSHKKVSFSINFCFLGSCWYPGLKYLPFYPEQLLKTASWSQAPLGREFCLSCYDSKMRTLLQSIKHLSLNCKYTYLDSVSPTIPWNHQG